MTNKTTNTAVLIVRRLRGKWNAKARCCPCCASNPPLMHCLICRGSYEFGPMGSVAIQAAWRVRFHYHLVRPEFRFLYPHQQGWRRDA